MVKQIAMLFLAAGMAMVAAASDRVGGATAQQGEFGTAVHLYKQGRWSAAFGKFVALANAAHGDAAHIALFMNRYGAHLYGAHWDAAPAESEAWATQVVDRDGRRMPLFVPDPYRAAATRRAPDDYDRAARLFREGRLGEAYGRFASLSARGDVDAAHAALFMNKYGPLLYGMYWHAAPLDLAAWARAVNKPGGRPAPAYVPPDYRVDTLASARFATPRPHPTAARRSPS